MSYKRSLETLQRRVAELAESRDLDTPAILGLLTDSNFNRFVGVVGQRYHRQMSAELVQSIASAAAHPRVSWQRDALGTLLRQIDRALEAEVYHQEEAREAGVRLCDGEPCGAYLTPQGNCEVCGEPVKEAG